MIKAKTKGSLIVISGPSGVGKDTIVNKLIKSNPKLHKAVNYTTRAKRKGETEGLDYHFITTEEFKEKIKDNQFLEYAKVHHKWYYGVSKEETIDKLNKNINVILIVDIAGAKSIKELIPEAIFIFLLPPSIQELKQRLKQRGTETKVDLFRRFKTAYQELNEFSKYNYVVVNDEITASIHKINAITIAHKSRVDRIEELDIDSLEELLHVDLVD